MPHRRRARTWLVVLAVSVLAACPEPDAEVETAGASAASDATAWTESEIRLLESLSVDALGPAPPAPSNRVADDPEAGALGRMLFFDPGLSGNGEVACASCHQPERFFTDGLARSRGLGETSRNAPTLVGVAHATWLFWDGRRDSLWSQALAPLEAGVEMGSTRVDVVRHVATGPATRERYARLFGRPAPFDDPQRFPHGAGPFADRRGREAWARMHPADRLAVDRAFANVGKGIAAFERGLRPGPSRFDRYVRGLRAEASAAVEPILSELEIRGLRLFVDPERTQCLRCHNGPLLTNQSFHHVGTRTDAGGGEDFGRFLGLQAVLVDPFNCLGPYSDALPEDCGALRFLDREHVADQIGRFKTPTLRGLPRTAPYMHDGRHETLAEVIEHYRQPPGGEDLRHELIPLDLGPEEAAALVAFLRTLDGAVQGAGPRPSDVESR